MSKACGEAALYCDCGVHGLIVENMHDVPYLNGGLGPEVTACMTRVTAEVRRQVPGLALGVQILSGELYSIIIIPDRCRYGGGGGLGGQMTPPFAEAA